jgi:hypothetical protein
MLGRDQVIDQIGAELSTGAGDEDSHGLGFGPSIVVVSRTVKPVPGLIEVAWSGWMSRANRADESTQLVLS